MALEHGMIEPFEDRQVREGVVSYGVSSYGYDMRVADEFKVFTNVYNTVVDPKNFDPRSFVDIKADVCIIPPNSFALARTIEYFRIPRDVLTVCLGKSTYARCGIIVNVTPFEPEWEGHVTIEISNTTPLPGEDLRPRGHRPGALLPERRAVRGVLQGQARQVPGAAGRHAAEDLRGQAACSRWRCRAAARRAGIEMLRTYRNIAPPSIAPPTSTSAQVVGDVIIGAESSVWMNVVIRGDVHRIRIGRRSNIQDLTMVHVMRDTHPTLIGDEVTVGHSAPSCTGARSRTAA
jgi:dCTP deaminase